MWFARLRRVAAIGLGGLTLGTPLHAAAQAWTLVHREPGMAYYVDKTAVRMQGAYLTYWILVTFHYDSTFDGAEPYKSARLLRYANCATREQDTKSILQYHDPMGRGEPVWAQTIDDATMRMVAVEPGSIGARLLEVACSLKQ